MVRTRAIKVYSALLSLLLILCSILVSSDLFSQEMIALDSLNFPPSSSQYEGEEEGATKTEASDKILDFTESSILQFNQFGSFGLRNNGIQVAVKSDHYKFFTGYGYENFNGFRQHDSKYFHSLDIGLETSPSSASTLKIIGSFLNGEVRLPGSLTREEFDQDPYMADPRSIDRDEKTKTTGGGVDIEYDSKFGKLLNNEIEIVTYGSVYFINSATREYRIINKYGFGLSARYLNTTKFGERTNNFSIGGEVSSQPQRTEYYDNLGGEKGDQIEQVTAQKATNAGLFFSDDLEVFPEKLFITLSGRYDNVVYRLTEETVPSRTEKKIFEALTPKVECDYTLLPLLTFFASYGLGFESPADRQLESPDPFYLYNPDLKAEKTGTIEAGIKGKNIRKDSSLFLKTFSYQASCFNTVIDNEIVPYEVFGDVYYRNATMTNRFGLELEARLEIYKNLNFTGSYVYSHFTYDSYAALSTEVDSTGNIVQIFRDFSGNTEPNIPENDLKLSLSYKHDISRKVNISCKISYLNLSGLWVDDANTDKTNSYDLLNADIGFVLNFGHFKLSGTGGVNNIFDKVYAGYVTSSSANKRFYNPGEPRNYFCSVNIGYLF
jgi:iron complex outermembrane recepter protein